MLPAGDSRHVELIVIINKICYCCIYVAAYIIVLTMHGHTNIKQKSETDSHIIHAHKQHNARHYFKILL